MAKKSVKSVDDYLASQPKAVRDVLDRVRSTVRKAVPRAEEAISYQIPAYKLHGRTILYFAGWKHHYSLYPAGSNVVAAFKKDLAPYEVARGTIRFPLSEPVPVKLIAGIAKLRAKQIAAGATAKSKVRKQRRARR
jgi:uncharacterized protein YdhG (YjbR/CyaY superfamily)